MSANITAINHFEHADLWRASARKQQAEGQTVASGFAELDRQLHLGGWPVYGSSELLCPQYGMGEMQLLLPALHRLMREQRKKWLAMITPPYIPFAPAILNHGLPLNRLLLVHASNTNDKIWAAEQLLRCGHFAAVLTWFHHGRENSLPYAQLRKLHIAAMAGHSLGIYFRPGKLASQSSPARLRLQLAAKKKHLLLNIIKQPAGWGGQNIMLPRPTPLLQNTLDASLWQPLFRQKHGIPVLHINHTVLSRQTDLSLHSAG